MSRILCSTGTMIGRPNGRDFTLLTEFLPHLSCDGLELLFFEAWYAQSDALCRFLDRLHVPVPVFHTEKFLGDKISRGAEGDLEEVLTQFEVNCRLAARIGAEKLVLHLWGGIDSDRDIARNIALYPALRALAGAHHLTLTVENVVCAHADPLTHLHTLARTYPDISFTIDTKMSEFHRQTLDLFSPAHRSLLRHVAHYHINDFGGTPGDFTTLRTLCVGEGRVNFPRFFAQVKESGYRGDFTVEATCFNQAGAVDLTRLEKTLRAVREGIE